MASDVIAAPPPARSAAKDWLRALELTHRAEADPAGILPAVIEAWARRKGDAPALVSDAEQLTYGALARLIAGWRGWAAARGLAKGDVVALVMRNRPDYLAVWLGLTSVGIVVALVSPALKGPSLAHALSVADPKHAIAEPELAPEIAAALPAMPVSDPAEVRVAAPAPPSPSTATLNDPALLIYTSGTTGLPKAARVSHRRIIAWSAWFAGLMDTRPTDRLYDCLPLHHSVGGVAAAGGALFAGASVAIAEKFSARRFWDDVTRFDATLVQYIGELCRYLLAAPPHPKERAHRLRIACGNGLSGDVWTLFQQRFAIPRILEFYASTEGAFSLFNVEGRPGAIGRLPPFLAHRFPAALVRYDAEIGAPARGPGGFCIRVARGEVGEAIGRIAGAGAGRFEGYTDAGETENKVLRDVFQAGDAWMRTGDLMRQDADGYFHFVDRIGDTFRWKGENVATTEVANALGACPGVEAVSVYGVQVPHASGRAGMAALTVGPTFELEGLTAHLAARLPEHAWPVFLRLASQLDITETLKPRKQALAAEGFDPGLIADPLFVLDRQRRAYVRLEAALYARIAEGALKL